jgi:hypothetical protein
VREKIRRRARQTYTHWRESKKGMGHARGVCAFEKDRLCVERRGKQAMEEGLAGGWRKGRKKGLVGIRKQGEKTNELAPMATKEKKISKTNISTYFVPSFFASFSSWCCSYIPLLLLGGTVFAWS